MSYDLTLLTIQPGATLEQEYESFIEACESDRPREKRLDQEAILAAIKEHYPDAARFDGEEYVELTVADDSQGVQFTVYGDHVGVSLPYWSTEAEAHRSASTLLGACAHLRDRFGLHAFDPQLGRELTPEQDLPDVLGAFGYGTRALRATVAGLRRPWWKLWG